MDVNGWPRYQTAQKNCRKIQPAEYRVRERYRRQTDGRTGDSICCELSSRVNVSSRSLKIGSPVALMLSDRCPVFCVSVCHWCIVAKTVGWMKMKLGMDVGLGHTV